MIVEIQTLFSAVKPAMTLTMKIAELLGIIESIDSKLDSLRYEIEQLKNVELAAGIRFLKQAENAADVDSYLNHALLCFNKAVSFEKIKVTKNTINAYLGLATCHYLKKDVINAGKTLIELAGLDINIFIEKEFKSYSWDLRANLEAAGKLHRQGNLFNPLTLYSQHLPQVKQLRFNLDKGRKDYLRALNNFNKNTSSSELLKKKLEASENLVTSYQAFEVYSKNFLNNINDFLEIQKQAFDIGEKLLSNRNNYIICNCGYRNFVTNIYCGGCGNPL